MTLLSALGITSEVLLQKQRDHFQVITTANSDLNSAILLISSNSVAKVVQTLDFDTEDFSRLRLVEDLIVKGLEDPTIQRKIRRIQDAEVSAAVNRRGEEKVRAIIPESRLLYGACDDEGTLKEREVFIRIEVPRKVCPSSLLPVAFWLLKHLLGPCYADQRRSHHCSQPLFTPRRYTQAPRGQ